MKKTLLVLLICLGNYSISLAQDEAFMEDALKLTRLSNDAVEASFGQLYAMIPAEKLEDFKEELKPVLDNYYTKMAKVSMEYYSHEDVKQLLDFYESDLGQKMLDAQAKLTVRSMEMAQPLSMELMPIVQKYSN
ncbi:DUF2059 domain-containing protein [Psychroflexus sp. CAK8W]|uniref:DUF2059 domain-containing protein n=1 Tax=Psychroflexus longus TaxID=2873596 RepID=A0ABS7XFW7_9FLAO|nr:DUF2059 domain-containing protein [Psychroflexus longus]MBZ9777833.1 DUF2059 domain-containing protein [Psychroflexus longus]